MTDGLATERGRCLCGDVRFEALIGAREAGACHCSMCRRWSGGVFLAVECRSVTVADERSLGVYSSSEWGERCFCKSCGSTLFWRSKDGKHTAVSIQAFDRPSEFRLVSQIFIDEKPDCYSFAEETKNITGAEFIAMIASSESQA